VSKEGERGWSSRHKHVQNNLSRRYIPATSQDKTRNPRQHKNKAADYFHVESSEGEHLL
jgi:hypothetical protein